MPTAFPIQHLGANIEIYSAPPVRGLIQHAVFDFDGTLSLIHAGWQEIMLEEVSLLLLAVLGREGI